jgi:hypothetical protein
LTKRLLDNYKKTVKATDNLVKTLEEVNFPKRLDKIEQQLLDHNEKVENRFNLIDKQNKLNKIVLLVVLGLLFISLISSIMFYYNPVK